MDVRLAMAGFGNVGRGVAQLLLEHRDQYDARYGMRLILTGVADRSGIAIDPNGLNESQLLLTKSERGSIGGHGLEDSGRGGECFLAGSQADVFIEASSTNFIDAEPGWSRIQEALSLRMDIVLASKGALVLYFSELMALASSHGKSVSYSATVGAPLPILDIAQRSLVGVSITGFEGVLNSTANVILAVMAQGKSYDEGVKAAQELGVAETDPTLDVDGWDAAAKAAIVANTIFGSSLRIANVTRTGIRDITAEQIDLARRSGAALKLVSRAARVGEAVAAWVGVEARAENDPLGRLAGSEMGAILHTDRLGDFTLTVENARGISGGIATANTVLRDVFNLAKERGWTSGPAA